MSNRLPETEHTSRAWRIHEIAPDFRVEDVWSFRTPGAGVDDFRKMLDALRAAGGPGNQSLPSRALLAVRWKLGALLGWDEPEQSIGTRVRSLRERLPVELRQPATGAPVPNTPFTTLYELHDEGAYELANKTVHDVLHLGWVQGANGDFELRMAALVRPNGIFGRLYMAGIAPFRYLVIYPAMTRQWERAWRDHQDRTSTARRARTARPRNGRTQMIKWAGRMFVFYGAAHMLAALTVEGAARHAGAWFRGELWHQDLANMSPAGSALWLSLSSFGVPLMLLGLTVLWLDRRGITPPSFIAWTLGFLTLVDAVIDPFTPWPIMLVANILLLVGARRAKAWRTEASLRPAPDDIVGATHVERTPFQTLRASEIRAELNGDTGRLDSL